jgi:CDP-paratose 2-epimerase
MTEAPILITGGAGFIGSNLADRLAGMGHDVVVYDSLARPGVEENLAWLKQRHPHSVCSVIADIRDTAALQDVTRNVQAVFHMAAQVAVTTSLVDPMTDFAVNLNGTVQLLEALRQRGAPVPLIFASTNKVYGNLADVALERSGETYQPVDAALRQNGISEQQQLDFHTPYGCSKGAADQYVLDFGRSFGLPTCVIRMSCIYGQLQQGTEDQGWVAHFLLSALRGQPITIFGDGCQVRDVLDVGDAVNAYVAAWQRIGQVKGRAYNLGGGVTNAVSLNQIIGHISGPLGYPIQTGRADWRAGDQRYYVSDTRRIRHDLDLPAPLGWRDGLRQLAQSLAGSSYRAPALAS